MAHIKTATERFYDRVIPEPNSGCWIWMGPLSPKGYGRFSYRGRALQVHRFSYELHTGRIAGESIDHLCRVRCCVNPDHLESVTTVENIRRGAESRGLSTHCRRGHPYSSRRERDGYLQAECYACRHLLRLGRKERAQNASARP